MFDAGWFTGAAGIWRRGRRPRPAGPLPHPGVRDRDGRGADPRRHRPAPGRGRRRGGPLRHARRARPVPARARGEHRRADRPDDDHQGRLDPPALRSRRRAGTAAAFGSGHRAAPRMGGGPGRRRRWPGTSTSRSTTARSATRSRSSTATTTCSATARSSCLLTPGHTPGHQSVRVGERLVIGGDVSHFASGPGGPPVPGVRRRLHALRRRRPSACARFATPEPSCSRAMTPSFSLPVPWRCSQEFAARLTSIVRRAS